MVLATNENYDSSGQSDRAGISCALADLSPVEMLIPSRLKAGVGDVGSVGVDIFFTCVAI